jgi:hypothetical protein
VFLILAANDVCGKNKREVDVKKRVEIMKNILAFKKELFFESLDASKSSLSVMTL